MNKDLLNLLHASIYQTNTLGHFVADQYPVNSPEWTACVEMCRELHNMLVAVGQWIDAEAQLIQAAGVVS